MKKHMYIYVCGWGCYGLFPVCACVRVMRLNHENAHVYNICVWVGLLWFLSCVYVCDEAKIHIYTHTHTLTHSLTHSLIFM
jgi:hypothetical protein